MIKAFFPGGRQQNKAFSEIRKKKSVEKDLKHPDLWDNGMSAALSTLTYLYYVINYSCYGGSTYHGWLTSEYDAQL